MSRALLAFNPEAHGIGGDTFLFGVPIAAVSPRAAAHELEELDLASHLLEASTNRQIAGLARHVIDYASKVTGRSIDPQVGALLQARLTDAGRILRTMLPSGGREAGAPVSAEVVFGTELEGLSPEDQEFEIARRIVRLMMTISRNAALTPKGAAPAAVVSHAERLAARQLAPGLSKIIGHPPMGFRARRRARMGQWAQPFSLQMQPEKDNDHA